mmetsp:Transcript_3453/g.9447  ORF Transcript_3453/g.9447 Transcript_3453/m.9447 type:complete len:301 (+) Transcript_3453:1506-2408(+)
MSPTADSRSCQCAQRRTGYALRSRSAVRPAADLHIARRNSASATRTSRTFSYCAALFIFASSTARNKTGCAPLNSSISMGRGRSSSWYTSGTNAATITSPLSVHDRSSACVRSSTATFRSSKAAPSRRVGFLDLINTLQLCATIDVSLPPSSSRPRPGSIAARFAPSMATDSSASINSFFAPKRSGSVKRRWKTRRIRCSLSSRAYDDTFSPLRSNICCAASGWRVMFASKPALSESKVRKDLCSSPSSNASNIRAAALSLNRSATADGSMAKLVSALSAERAIITSASDDTRSSAFISG